MKVVEIKDEETNDLIHINNYFICEFTQYEMNDCVGFSRRDEEEVEDLLTWRAEGDSGAHVVGPTNKTRGNSGVCRRCIRVNGLNYPCYPLHRSHRAPSFAPTVDLFNYLLYYYLMTMGMINVIQRNYYFLEKK